MHSLTAAADAGEKTTVYAWQNVSIGLIDGQSVMPFHALYQGVPTVYVQGDYEELNNLVGAAKNDTDARIILDAKRVPNTSTRSIWTAIGSSDLANEYMIINTHTDGINNIEENGYIALLAYVK